MDQAIHVETQGACYVDQEMSHLPRKFSISKGGGGRVTNFPSKYVTGNQ